jgi:hypothetical protein
MLKKQMCKERRKEREKGRVLESFFLDHLLYKILGNYNNTICLQKKWKRETINPCCL